MNLGEDDAGERLHVCFEPLKRGVLLRAIYFHRLKKQRGNTSLYDVHLIVLTLEWLSGNTARQTHLVLMTSSSFCPGLKRQVRQHQVHSGLKGIKIPPFYQTQNDDDDETMRPEGRGTSRCLPLLFRLLLISTLSVAKKY